MGSLLQQGCFWDAVPAAARGTVRDDVYVLGIGHLAAAVRVELASRGSALECQPGGAPLIVACSDYENRASFEDAGRRATEEHSPILFACLADSTVRIGPFAVPGEAACFERFHTYEPPPASKATSVVWHPRLLAGLGATLVAGEIGHLLARQAPTAR